MLPQSLLNSLSKLDGFNADAFINVHAQKKNITSVRINDKKWSPDKDIVASHFQNLSQSIQNETITPVLWNPYGYYISQRPQFIFDPYIHGGAYYVQEASSMFLWQALQQCIPETQSKKILDLCAAPGGKTTLMQSYAKGALVVSNEVIKSRASILTENVTKWGADNIIVTNNDPKDFNRLPGFFDAMVVDAPCSGSGLFRKDEHAISEWSEENVMLCSQRQQRILADALPALKEDGILIYSTCSYSVEEDETIADWLCEEMGMENIALQINDEWNIVATESPKHKAKGYRFYPHLLNGEGFFIAVFKKVKTQQSQYFQQVQLENISKKETEIIHSFYKPDSKYFLFKTNEDIKFFPVAFEEDLKAIAKNLYIKKAGTVIGQIKGNDVIPHHELALSQTDIKQSPFVNVDYKTAVKYLKRKDIELNASKGWNIIQHDGISLGWVKILPNRVNNYYPVGWRILKE